MSCSANCRNPIYCIVPPYVHDAIARNGTPEQRVFALRNKALDATFRSLRLVSQAALMAIPRGSQPPTLALHLKNRTIYTSKNQQVLPGTQVRAEGQPATGDPAVDEAYDGLGATFDFYDRVFSRNSIDDRGLPLLASVHFDKDYDNAYWNSSQMVFGDGDGQIFNRFTLALDVIGHELTHGVTEHEAKLQYFGQSGALNESISDVFGSLIKQYKLGQTADAADWLIGVGLLNPSIHGVAIRSMKNPGTAFDDPVLGKDPQPGNMSDFVETMEDSGGVHTNSGIPNRAFYLLAAKLGGHAWEKAGKIWYETIRNPHLRPTATFQSFGRVTFDVAGTLFGTSGAEQAAVKAAWSGVGVTL